MSATNQRETQLPDLDTLDMQSLKALVLAKQAELFGAREKLPIM